MLNELGLGFIVLGLMLFSIGLHYKKDGEHIRYTAPWGFAGHLKPKGKIMFYLGFLLAAVGFVLFR